MTPGGTPARPVPVPVPVPVSRSISWCTTPPGFGEGRRSMSASFTKQRTYDRETYLRARAAWDAGRFGPEWSDWRGLAGKAGIIFPPDGSIHDSWTDARPSQRAMVIRAIRETPRLLRWALTRPGVQSWGDVIEKLLEGRDLMGVEGDRRAEDWEAVKRGEDPVGIAEVMATIRDSLGAER